MVKQIRGKNNGRGLCFGISIIALLISGCAPSRLVRPLGVREQRIGLTAGGPLINYSDNTIPMPLTSFYYARGITNTTTVFGSLHTTSLLFGVIQTDVGACKELYYNKRLRLGLTVNPILNLAADKWKTHLKAWPELDVNTYWEVKPNGSFLYAGLSNWFDLSKNRANDETQSKHWLFNPHLGFNYERNQWSFVIEAKFLVPDVSTTPNVVEYKGINGNGALGIYLGASRTLK